MAFDKPSAATVTAAAPRPDPLAASAPESDEIDAEVLDDDAFFATLREGMTQYELQRYSSAAHARLGGTNPWALAGFGAASAFPHGTVQPQRIAPASPAFTVIASGRSVSLVMRGAK